MRWVGFKQSQVKVVVMQVTFPRSGEVNVVVGGSVVDEQLLAWLDVACAAKEHALRDPRTPLVRVLVP